jgi:hypothetical protein
MRTSTFSVGAGDRLVFYTDGLLEARDRSGRYFRLEDCLETLRRSDLDAAADELLGRLRAHTGRRLDDDVAVLLFEAASRPAQPQDEAPATVAPACGAVPGRDLAAAGAGFRVSEHRASPSEPPQEAAVPHSAGGALGGRTRMPTIRAPKISSLARRLRRAAWSGSGPCRSVWTGSTEAVNCSKSSRASRGTTPVMRNS